MSIEALLEADAARAAREALAGRRAWIVGGAVRDALLGRPIVDVDLAVEGSPKEAAKAVARAGRGPAFQLSEAFGAWRAMGGGRGGDPANQRWVCDVSPLQGETIKEDLTRRDFTINAMAVPLEGGDLLDPHGGQADVQARTLRVLPGAYESDALRPLRLARLATELGFTPDPDTEEATRAAAPRVTEPSPERVFAELRRMIVSDGVVEGIGLADRLGLLGAVLPELTQLHGVEQSRYHHRDVYGHTIEVLERQVEIERDPASAFGPELGPRVDAELRKPLGDELNVWQGLRLVALLHDIAKPQTRGVLPDGRVTFMGHHEVGVEMIDGICRRLRTSARLRHFLGDVTRYHLVLGFLVHERPLSRALVYRYLKTCSPVELEVTVHSCADRLATRGDRAEEAIEVHLELARELAVEALEWRARPPKPPLRGNELASELDIPPGPEIGALLARLEEAAFAGEAPTREAALALARRLRDNLEPVIVDCAVYDDGRRTQQSLDVREAYELGSSGDGRFVWIGLHDPEPSEFDSVAREFELHELAAEDATKPHQRPKLEVYGDTIVVVMRTVHYEEADDQVETGQIMVFAGPGFVITVRHGPYTDLHPVREWVEERPELLRCGPGAVVHAVIDRVVDEYEPVTREVEDDIEEVENDVFSADRSAPTERIYVLQREVLELHRAVGPLVDPLRRLARAEFDLVHEDLKHYFADVYDHVLRTDERVQGFRDLLHGVLEANLAQVSIRQNDDIRRISAWVAIIAVPTMVAGIYGMNFEHMPELRWEYGYPLVLAVIASACVGLYAYFKRVGWL